MSPSERVTTSGLVFQWVWDVGGKRADVDRILESEGAGLASWLCVSASQDILNECKTGTRSRVSGVR